MLSSQLMRSLFELMLNTVAENRRLICLHDNTKVLEQLTQQHYQLMQAILNGEQEQARSVISDHLNFVHNKLNLPIQTRPDCSVWAVFHLLLRPHHDYFLQVLKR